MITPSITVFVFGYQHCGTTILKRCFGSHPDTQEVKDEVRPERANIPWYGTPTIVMKHAATFAPNLPYLNLKLVRPINIIRNPFDVMVSLKKRHANLGLLKNYQPFRMWENWARYWVNPDKGVTTVRYEDLFEDNNALVYKLLKDAGLECGDIQKQLSESPMAIHYSSIPKSEPLRTSHEAFRSWQINQPFERRSQDLSALSAGEVELIKTSEIAKVIYPTDDE